jgi:hypothetical protein
MVDNKGVRTVKGKHVEAKSKNTDGRLDALQNDLALADNKLEQLGGQFDQSPRAEGKGFVPGAICTKAMAQADMYNYDSQLDTFKKRYKEEYPDI